MKFVEELDQDFFKIDEEARTAANADARELQGRLAEKAILVKYLAKLSGNTLSKEEMTESSKTMVQNMKYL